MLNHQHKLPTWLSLAVLLTGIPLRVLGLTVSPIWYDEAYAIYLARYPQWMVQIEYSDFNPPLWQLLVTPVIQLLGENELALRAPALICSLLALWLAWRIAMQLLPDRPGIQLGSAALMAYLPYHFWLAQDGRPYALLSLLYLAVIYFGLQGRWLGLAGCLGLMCYTHSTGLFYAASACLGLLIIRPRDWLPILISGMAAIAAMLPWLPTYFSRVGDHWLSALTGEELLKALYFSIWAGALPPVWAYGAIWLMLITLVAALLVSAWRWRNRIHAALTIWAVGPLAILLVVAIVKNLIFYRPLSGMLLPLCIWIPASLWPATRRQWTWGWVPVYLWGLAIVIGLLCWSPGIKGGDLRQVAQQINAQWQPGDVVYHATGSSYLPMSLYLDQPGYVIDEAQHDGLLQTELQVIFGIPRADLAAIPHRRAWVVWAKDIIMSPTAWRRMDEITQAGQMVGVVEYWQAADIYVYLVEVQ